MTDAMRDMIAQLMGSQKDAEEGRDLPPYDHVSVCRAYLVGCCPYELVPDSRLQGMLNCRKLHEPAHKADFQTAQDKKDHYYDVEGFEALDNAVNVVDGEIERIKFKLDKEAKDQTDNAEQVKAERVKELDVKIQKAVDEMESLGNLGKVNESMKLEKYVDELRSRKADLMAQTEMRLAGPGSNASRLRVCEDCGAQLNIMDHESRIADHFNGKMHLGMVDVREKHTQMKETIEDRRNKRKEVYGEDMSRYGTDKRRSPPRRFQERRDKEDRGDRYSSNKRRSRSRSRDRERRRDDRDKDRSSYGGRDRRDRDRGRRY